MTNIAAVVLPYLGRIVAAIVIYFLGKKVIQLIVELVEKRMSSVQVDVSLRTFISPLVRITLQILLFLTIAATLGIEITTFAAIIGAASLAVGLAFQGSLANFAGGVLILIFKPFKVGDFISANGFSGTVKEIQVFYTILQTIENQKVIIPNADLSNASAVNYSAYELRRTNFKLAISYESNLQAAKEAIQGVAEKHPLILEDPPMQIVMGEYGEHGAILYVRVWAKRTDYWAMYFEFLEQIKEALDEAGVKIPYHQLDVHLKKEDA